MIEQVCDVIWYERHESSAGFSYQNEWSNTELPLTMNIRRYLTAKCKFSGELCNKYLQKPNAAIVCTNIYNLPQKGQVIGYTLLCIFSSMQTYSPAGLIVP